MLCAASNNETDRNRLKGADVVWPVRRTDRVTTSTAYAPSRNRHNPLDVRVSLIINTFLWVSKTEGGHFVILVSPATPVSTLLSRPDFHDVCFTVPLFCINLQRSLKQTSSCFLKDVMWKKTHENVKYSEENGP